MPDSWRRGTAELWDALVSLLYPARCVVCREFGPETICRRCLESFPLMPDTVCRRCGVEVDTGERPGRAYLCADCRGLAASHFDWARARGRFEGTLRTAIHRLKYDGRKSVAVPLGAWMRGGEKHGLRPPHAPDLVMPVPLHPTRLLHRGFNQSLLLARAYIGGRDWHLDPRGLKRTRNTRPQVTLPASERERNVRGAFAVTDPDRVRGKRVLLVDDVLTTMHTVIECSRVLKEAGAMEVYVVAVAR